MRSRQCVERWSLSQFGAEGGTGSVLLGILVTIGVGILGGLLNGSMIVAFNVHPFIITLGTMAIYRGQGRAGDAGSP